MLASKAPAKINWTLEVLGRRDDGYHEIASVMSTVSLCDELTLEPAGSWSVTVDAPERLRVELETGDNLVKRATALFVMELAQRRGAVTPAAGPVWPPPPDYGPPARFHLTKRIPAPGGLGGGSSDAAAALRLLFRAAANAGLEVRDGAWLRDIAARLGSDVPFFVEGGTRFARGRGERLVPLAEPAPTAVVLLTPPVSVAGKTARLYSLLRPAHYTDGAASHTLARRLSRPGAVIDHADLFNAFDAVAGSAFPGIDAYREQLGTATGGAVPHLCGAGPTLFALIPSLDAAVASAARLRHAGLSAWAVHVLPPTPAYTPAGDEPSPEMER